jgi:hypothetical protein
MQGGSISFGAVHTPHWLNGWAATTFIGIVPSAATTPNGEEGEKGLVQNVNLGPVVRGRRKGA